MSKELDALKRLYEHLDAEDLAGDDYYISEANKDFDSIETALNDNHFYLYIIDKICKYLGIDINSHRDLIEIENEILNTLVENEKKLKAFKIIKEKTNLTKTNDGKKALVFVILETQEEFELLKEVLL